MQKEYTKYINIFAKLAVRFVMYEWKWNKNGRSKTMY